MPDAVLHDHVADLPPDELPPRSTEDFLSAVVCVLFPLSATVGMIYEAVLSLRGAAAADPLVYGTCSILTIISVLVVLRLYEEEVNYRMACLQGDALDWGEPEDSPVAEPIPMCSTTLLQAAIARDIAAMAESVTDFNERYPRQAGL